MKRSMKFVALLGVVLSAGAARADDMKGMDMSKPAASPAAETPADKAYAASMASMMKGMDVKPTGNPDLDFVDMMMPHHQGAIDMAKVELQYGKDPILRKLAQDIVKAQETEIGDMMAWKAAHRK